LKRLIVSGTDDPLWKAQLNPVDRPDFAPEQIDLDAAIKRALAERTDIITAKEQLDINNANVQLLRDQTLPAVDLSAGYGLSGIGGTTYVRNGLGGSISDILPGGYWDALRTLGNLAAPSWNLAVNVTYPLGTSTADANLARGKVQVQQSLAQIKQLELQVATDVTNAALNVESNLESVQAARAARELAQQRLDAENAKFQVGMSTNFFVVQAQRDLADAANTELGAIRNYRRSLVDFDRLQQTSLSRANITLVSGGGGGGTTSTTSTSNTGTSGTSTSSSATSTSTRTTTGGQ
jgi:outer membrane protein